MPTYYQTADGTMVPTPRSLHISDAFIVTSYLAMRISDAVTDTANMVYALLLSHRDQVDAKTAFLREGLEEIVALTSHKTNLNDAEYRQSIEDAFAEIDLDEFLNDDE